MAISAHVGGRFWPFRSGGHLVRSCHTLNQLTNGACRIVAGGVRPATDEPRAIVGNQRRNQLISLRPHARDNERSLLPHIPFVFGIGPNTLISSIRHCARVAALSSPQPLTIATDSSTKTFCNNSPPCFALSISEFGVDRDKRGVKFQTETLPPGLRTH